MPSPVAAAANRWRIVYIFCSHLQMQHCPHPLKALKNCGKKEKGNQIKIEPIMKLTNKRLVSLDVFRGLTIAGMIVVNMPGSWQHVYPPLRHATWHGVTPTDLVFPFFVFIVGVSIVLAYTKRLKSRVSKSKMMGKIIRRSITIFLLGIFLALFPEFNFAELRIAGVLQRIAVCFLACAILFLRTDWKRQLQIGVVALVGYWLAMMLIPVPEVGMGSLEPDKNVAAWIDNYLLPGRMYQETWDPEGVFSTIPAIASCISGMLVGHLLISNQTQNQKLIWLFSLGFLTFVAGNIWDWFFPINKNLWTSSYVLYTSGLAAMTLATCIWLVDVQGYKKWTKFGVIFGMNAIAAYVLHGMLFRLFIIPLGDSDMTIKGVFMEELIGTGLAPNFVSLLWALLYLGLCFIPIWMLYQRKIFIKV